MMIVLSVWLSKQSREKVEFIRNASKEEKVLVIDTIGNLNNYLSNSGSLDDRLRIFSVFLKRNVESAVEDHLGKIIDILKSGEMTEKIIFIRNFDFFIESIPKNERGKIERFLHDLDDCTKDKIVYLLTSTRPWNYQGECFNGKIIEIPGKIEYAQYNTWRYVDAVSIHYPAGSNKIDDDDE